MRKLFTILACSLFLNALPARAQSDAIDIRESRIVNSPDVRSWPVTTALTQMAFDGSTTRVEFTKKDGPGRWPDVTPAGWDGPLEYTLWLFLQVNGEWVGSAFIQMWNGRDGSGSSGDPDVPSLYHQHWYYAQRWSPLFGHGQIRPGEQIGFMVTSGNARDSVGPYGPSERSNIVTLAAVDNGTFRFAASPAPVPVPIPPSPPSTPVVVVPAPNPPLPSQDLAIVIQQLQQCIASIQQVGVSVEAGRVENRGFYDAVRSEWKTVVKYAAPIIGALFAGKQLK